jgi:hypothetical protein
LAQAIKSTKPVSPKVNHMTLRPISSDIDIRNGSRRKLSFWFDDVSFEILAASAFMA